MNSSGIISRGYKPPRQIGDEKENTLRTGVSTCKSGYYERAGMLELLAARIAEIMQNCVGEDNEKGKIDSELQQCRKPFDNKKGANWMVYSAEYEAYKFLSRECNFNNNIINVELVNEIIEKLKRKAIECRAAEDLFFEIKKDKDFQIHPSQYIENWRNSITQPSVEQRKAIKCFDSIESKFGRQLSINSEITIK